MLHTGRRIYLDHASLTPVDPRVMREMKRYSSIKHANPSSLHKEGVAARKAVEAGRSRVAAFLHAHPDEVTFVSGGTEANGLALEGAGRAAFRARGEPQHLIISAIEHSSVMECASMMERHGVEVTRLSVDAQGMISLEELKKSIRPNTYMVSIMAVNNETGAVQLLREIAKIVRQARKARSGGEGGTSSYPLFHTDAAQAALYYDLDMEKIGIDLLTLDGGKACGPRGIGALYVRRGTPIEQIIYGGGQESGLRSGTENVPAIAGFAKALDIATRLREKETVRVAGLSRRFVEGLKALEPDIKVNSALSGQGASPHILNISIPGLDNEFFVLQLDARGVACSTKSSCLKNDDESYVLRATGADSRTSVRFSFGRQTKGSDIGKALDVIAKVLKV